MSPPAYFRGSAPAFCRYPTLCGTEGESCLQFIKKKSYLVELELLAIYILLLKMTKFIGVTKFKFKMAKNSKNTT